MMRPELKNNLKPRALTMAVDRKTLTQDILGQKGKLSFILT